MSNTSPTSDEPTTDTPSDNQDPPPTAELAVLREENDRLRAEYRRARQHQHRQSALALAGIGVLAAVAALLFPGMRDLLLVFAAIGGFGATLTYYLTSERVLTASVVDGIHTAHTDTIQRLIEELGLQDTLVYLPVDDPRERTRVFIPQHVNYDLPTDRTQLFVGTDTEGSGGADRGICLVPVGHSLLDALEPGVQEADTPRDAIAVAAAGVTEQFELADTVDYDVADGRATLSVDDVRPRDLSTLEHPVVSVCGVALADVVAGPVTVAERDTDNITFTWDTPTEPTH